MLLSTSYKTCTFLWPKLEEIYACESCDHKYDDKICVKKHNEAKLMKTTSKLRFVDTCDCDESFILYVYS